MKSQEPKEKKFRQLSDEELEKVTGGKEKPDQPGPTECNNSQYALAHQQECVGFTVVFDPGLK